MRFFLHWSIRAQLLFLVIICVLPAMGIILYSGIEHRSIAIEETKESALRLIRTVAGRHQVIEESTHQLLMILAKMPDVQNLNIKVCNALFRQLLPQNPLYGNIFFVEKNGWLVASAVPTKPKNVAERKYYRDIVINKRDFSTGEHAIGLIIEIPVFHFAYPVSDKKGSLKGLVGVAVNLKNYDSIIAQANLPDGSNLILADHQGMRLYRYPDNDKYGGHQDLPKMTNYMAGSSDDGTFRETGVDGKKRVYAYKKIRLPNETHPYLYMRLGIPEEQALSRADSALLRDLLILALIFIIALACAWYLGGVLIANPLKKLIAATDLFKRGERVIPTDLPHNKNELAHLAEAFDEMTAELNKSESELNKLAAVLQESEEKYRLIVENAREGIMVAQDLTLIFVNRSTSDILGYSAEILTSKPFVEFIHPVDRNFVLARHMDRLQGKEIPPVYSFRIVCADNTIKLIELNAAMITWKNKPATVNFISDITKRMQAENALRESEERYRLLIDTANEGIWAMDADHITTYVNKAMADMLYYSPPEIIGKKVEEFFYPEDMAFHQERMKRRHQGDDEVYERRFRRKDGSELWTLVSAKSLKSENGGFIGSFAMFTDITDRKLSEGKLQISEAKFNNLFHLNPVAQTLSTLHDERFLDVNDVFLRAIESNREEVIGHTAKELGVWHDPEQRNFVISSLAENGFVNNVEMALHSKSGNIRHFLWSAKKIIISGESCLLASAINITALNEARMALQQSERRLNDIIDFFPDAMLAVDTDQKVIVWNRAIEKMTGIKAADMIGKGNHEYSIPFYGVRRPQLIDLIWKDDPDLVGKYNYVNRDGESLTAEVFCSALYSGRGAHILAKASPLHDQNGNIAGAIESVRDMTDLKLLEKKFLHSQKIEALGVLSGGIAHDFNNILGSLLGYTEMAAEEKDESARRHCLEQVLIACGRARDLVQQILAFSYQADSANKHLDLRLIVKEALNLLCSTIPATIEIRRQITNKICPVTADPTQMHQVIINLCTNAVHALGEKGGILEVSLSREEGLTGRQPNVPDLKPGPYIKLTVSDNGSGIDPVIIDRIYDPFFTTKKVGEGTGLGLSVVYGIIKKQGGTINVTSQPGRGATFIIYIPCAAKAKHEQVNLPAALLPQSKVNEHILFVDDDKALAKMGKKMLSSLGYEVTTFTDSRKAANKFHANPDMFDMVITDMTMPHLTGKDLSREIIKSRPDMPIILCTGYSEFINEEKALQMGIKAMIMKPFTKKDLAAAVREILDRS